MAIQLDFLQDSPLDEIRQQIQQVKDSSDKVRKGLFARHGELAKFLMNLDERLSIIESGICRQKLHIEECRELDWS